jgi:hypothetical protein
LVVAFHLHMPIDGLEHELHRCTAAFWDACIELADAQESFGANIARWALEGVCGHVMSLTARCYTAD